MTKISSTEAKVTTAITAIDGQMAEVTIRLGELALARQDQEQDETRIDRGEAREQVLVQQQALNASRQLLEELLSRTREAGRDRVENRFGDHNRGVQLGSNHGTMNYTNWG